MKPRGFSVFGRVKSTDNVNNTKASPERERRGKPVVWSTPTEVVAMPAVTAPR